MVILLIIVTGSSPTSSADESLPQPVEDGSTYSSIRDPRRILRYIPIRAHQHRLAAYYLSCREMEAREHIFHEALLRIPASNKFKKQYPKTVNITFLGEGPC